MTFLIIPKRFSEQRQQLLELSTTYKYSAQFFTTLTDPFYKDIVAGNNLSSGSMVAPSRVARPSGLTSYFDGATTSLGTATALVPTPAFTVLCWVRPAVLNPGYIRILETDFTTGFYLGANTGTQYAWIVDNGTLEGCIGGQQVAGQRDFLVGVFDGTNRILYVNGIQVASASATAPTNVTNVLVVGAYPFANNTSVWNGDIDNVGVFNRAFTPAEIYSLSQNPAQLFKTVPRKLFLVQSAGGGVTGTSATTNADDTSAAQGTTTVVGTVAYTNVNDTSAANGTTTVTGSVAYTNLDDTGAANGTTTVTGTSATTNADDTASASGSSGLDVTGTVAYTNIDDTSNATGTTTVTGTSSTTNANDTATASGSSGTDVVGTVAYTNADDTASATGTTTVVGTSSTTNTDDSASASGTTTVTGTSATTNANDTATASGSPVVSGASATTNADDTSDATGTTEVTGSAAATNADDTCDASGTATSDVIGTVSYTNANDTSNASGTTTVLGSAAPTNISDTSSASGIVAGGVIVEVLSPTSTTSSSKIKKPGIPTGTPDWLKTTLEILMGRRGNRITIPAQPTLTFSAAPTQAECEALYAYTNSVRGALEQIITRMDS